MRSIAWTSVFLLVACAGEAPPVTGDDEPGPDAGMPGEQPTEPVVRSVLGGTFRPLAAFSGIEGRALLVRKLDGTSEVSIALNGGTAGTDYVAHVHIAPCSYQIVVPPAVATATGHYMIDPALAATTTEANEMWVHPTTSATGMIVGSATFTHMPREEAISVVVHDPVMGKMACADLTSDETASTIEFSGLAAAFPTAGVDIGVTGTVAATRTANSTTFTLTLAGLTAANTYEAHVHNEPCAITTGGTHYMIDPTVAPPALQANEVWFTVPAASTTANLPVTVPFGARTDAQSIVAHRVETDVGTGVVTKVKIACGDLTRMTAIAPFETTASAQALPAAAGMSLTGTALMTRKFNGVTEVAVVMTGLAANTTYAAHVHNQPCSVEAGGGHYKFDPASTEATNEMTFALEANAEGTASDSTWVAKIASAEAQSMIVHGADGSRLACFDLK